MVSIIKKGFIINILIFSIFMFPSCSDYSFIPNPKSKGKSPIKNTKLLPLPRGEIGITLGMTYREFEKLNMAHSYWMEPGNIPPRDVYQIKELQPDIEFIMLYFNRKSKRLVMFWIAYKEGEIAQKHFKARMTSYKAKYGEPKYGGDTFWKYYTWSDGKIELSVQYQARKNLPPRLEIYYLYHK